MEAEQLTFEFKPVCRSMTLDDRRRIQQDVENLLDELNPTRGYEYYLEQSSRGYIDPRMM